MSEEQQTACTMHAGRRGINVYLRDDVPIYGEGKPAHPDNRGILCGKGGAVVLAAISSMPLERRFFAEARQIEAHGTAPEDNTCYRRCYRKYP